MRASGDSQYQNNVLSCEEEAQEEGSGVGEEWLTSCYTNGARRNEDDDKTSGELSPLSGATDASATIATTRTRRSRKSPRQAGEEKLDAKLEHEELRHRYKTAFKQAAALMADPRHNESVISIVERLNAKHSLIGTSKFLCRSTLYRAVSKGSNGKTSPAKKGQPIKIPDVLLKAVATHAQVSQCGDDGEMRGREIKRLIGAAVIGTQYHGTFTFESAWTKLRREFPEQLQPANKMSMDDSRAQWTTYSNLQQWFDDAKNCLIGSGLLIDAEVRDVNGVLLSELDFRSDDV